MLSFLEICGTIDILSKNWKFPKQWINIYIYIFLVPSIADMSRNALVCDKNRKKHQKSTKKSLKLREKLSIPTISYVWILSDMDIDAKWINNQPHHMSWYSDMVKAGLLEAICYYHWILKDMIWKLFLMFVQWTKLWCPYRV